MMLIDPRGHKTTSARFRNSFGISQGPPFSFDEWQRARFDICITRFFTWRRISAQKECQDEDSGGRCNLDFCNFTQYPFLVRFHSAANCSQNGSSREHVKSIWNSAANCIPLANTSTSANTAPWTFKCERQQNLELLTSRDVCPTFHFADTDSHQTMYVAAT